jgi:hypothetical protein
MQPYAEDIYEEREMHVDLFIGMFSAFNFRCKTAKTLLKQKNSNTFMMKTLVFFRTV